MLIMSSREQIGCASSACMLIAFLVCTFLIGGTAAKIAMVLYSVIVGLGLAMCVISLINIKSVSMATGIVDDPSTGRRKVDIGRYDQFIEDYDNRYSGIYLVTFLFQMAWVAALVFAEYYIILAAFLASLVASETAKYRMYQCMKKNKMAWGAAAFIPEIQNFFNKDKEE
jgi:hypothetical protein